MRSPLLQPRVALTLSAALIALTAAACSGGSSGSPAPPAGNAAGAPTATSPVPAASGPPATGAQILAAAKDDRRTLTGTVPTPPAVDVAGALAASLPAAKPFGSVSASDTASALRFMTKVVAATHGDPQDLCKPLSAPSTLGAFSTYDTETFLNDPKNASRAKNGTNLRFAIFPYHPTCADITWFKPYVSVGKSKFEAVKPLSPQDTIGVRWSATIVYYLADKAGHPQPIYFDQQPVIYDARRDNTVGGNGWQVSYFNDASNYLNGGIPPSVPLPPNTFDLAQPLPAGPASARDDLGRAAAATLTQPALHYDNKERQDLPASNSKADNYVLDRHITGTLYPAGGNAALVDPPRLKDKPDDTVEERVYGQSLVLTKHKPDKQWTSGMVTNTADSGAEYDPYTYLAAWAAADTAAPVDCPTGLNGAPGTRCYAAALDTAKHLTGLTAQLAYNYLTNGNPALSGIIAVSPAGTITGWTVTRAYQSFGQTIETNDDTVLLTAEPNPTPMPAKPADKDIKKDS